MVVTALDGASGSNSSRLVQVIVLVEDLEAVRRRATGATPDGELPVDL